MVRPRKNGAARSRRRSEVEEAKRMTKRHNTINDLITHTLLVLMAINQLTCTSAAQSPRQRRPHEDNQVELRRLHKQSLHSDMAAADQLMDEPTVTLLDHEGGSYAMDEAEEQQQQEAAESPFATLNNRAHHHNSQLRAMRDLFERRHLGPPTSTSARMGQSSQELSPISIGLDPSSPFGMPPFGNTGDGASPPPPPPPRGLSNADEPTGGGLPFGLNPLPHLLGFQGGVPFDGPQRGDQSAHTNHHAAASQTAPSGGAAGGGGDPELGPSQKVWPKIFRFTDGRINLSDFEKQKKIRLSSKNQHGENHIESAPIMFDGRQLKRKSFLILHGGVFQGNR